MGTQGQLIAHLGSISLGMAEMQLKEITPAMFARLPAHPTRPGGVIQTNHPAFVYGHLAIYPAMLLGYLGLDPAPATAPKGFEDVFANGKPCLDDPKATIYPAMSAVTEAFFASHRALLAALPEVSDAALAKDHPREQSRSRFPTLAHAATFTLTGHIMFHLGQVSAWRRAQGLGSVM